jgi:hypothetical protein
VFFISVPVPALNAPAVAHKLQQGLWGGSQAHVASIGAPCEALQMLGIDGLVVAVASAATFTIQWRPTQLSFMFCGASFARSVQVMSRRWLDF